MLGYILRRTLLMPLLVLGVVTVAFFISHTTKGDPLASILPEQQMDNPEAVAAARQLWGLDRSLPEQYVIYVRRLLSGHLGTSFITKRDVGADILERLPATLELVVAAMFVGTTFGISLGVLAAYAKNTMTDHLARLFALCGSSVPIFWSGLAALYVFSVLLGWLPGPGRNDPGAGSVPAVTGLLTLDALIAGHPRLAADALAHLVLPALLLGWAVSGTISRLVRASMLDVLAQDYVMTARAKGAGELRVLLQHALRNTMLPTLTILGHSFAYLITGAVMTETIFSWPGVGSYAVDAARSLDYPAIIGVTIVGGLAFLLVNLVTDIAYAYANPRIRLS